MVPYDRRASAVEDHVALGRDVIGMIWEHRLWWVVPVVLALIALGLVLVLEATPVGPLLYPLF